MYYYAAETIEKLKTASQLVVFGAGDIAYLIAGCLLSELYQLPIEYCMVSKREGNPGQVRGIPVIDYMDAERLVHKDALVLMTVMERHLDSAIEGLHRHGYNNTMPLTFESDLWSLLRGNCYRNHVLAQNKPYLTVEEGLKEVNEDSREKTIRLYTAKSHVDRVVKEDALSYSWEVPIQVGAALTPQRICDICDDTGDNISTKNRQYCELTALYWIWKNDISDYVGLGHYRRHFELDTAQLKLLTKSDIDVVLTIPIMDVPTVEAIYRRDHIGNDWDVMLEAVGKLCPAYLEAVREMGNGSFYYAYNMFIMRREILEDYCEWLFPILFYCEEHCGDKEDNYQNRYIGFLAEHLMSAYFLYHERDYRIAHARKHFIL